jgi:hypothetical protein
MCDHAKSDLHAESLRKDGNTALNDGDLLKTVEYVSEKKFKIRFKKIKNSF